MIDHYRMLADYNRWANERLYAAATGLSDEAYRADRGAFFGSLHRTLNHLLVADRVWMRRLTGEGPQMSRLDEIVHDDLASLHAARRAEDARIAAWLATLAPARLDEDFVYSPLSAPGEIRHPVRFALAHLFNHQAHHRGQCHTILTSLGSPSLALDLIYFLRAEGAGWMAKAAT